VLPLQFVSCSEISIITLFGATLITKTMPVSDTRYQRLFNYDRLSPQTKEVSRKGLPCSVRDHNPKKSNFTCEDVPNIDGRG
jgi:hypothetical protein